MKCLVDFSKNIGRIKAVNGVSNGPICHDIDLSEHFKELNISTVRYHDTDGSGTFGRCAIDVSRIFENFDADEFDENNYRFEHTDKILLSATNSGAEVIYRLGESIDHSVYKRYAHPPKDFDKWVRICLQIIKHYNSGWANGYNLNIKYWEIWNEPEGHATDGTQPMWSGGTFEQMLELYKKIAIAIKDYDSSLKVGGLSFMYNDFAVEPFLSFCNKEKLPVDFLSFHHYAQEYDWLTSQTLEAKRLLDKFGFSNSEIVIAEYQLLLLENYDGTYWDFIADPVHQRVKNRELFSNQRSNMGASFLAGFLSKLNDLPVDKAIYYDFDPNSRWCSLFDEFYEPQKPYYALKAYGEILSKSSYRAFAESDVGCIIASKGDTCLHALYSNFSTKFGPMQFVFNGLQNKHNLFVYCIDEKNCFEIISNRTVKDGDVVEFNVNKNSVLFFEIK